MHSFEYQKVYSLKEASNIASTLKGETAFMAGGTDLLVQIKEGEKRPRYVIDLKEIHEMNGIKISDDHLSIGALTSIRTLEKSPLILEKIPLLSQAASKLGSVQIRNRATIGGNIANASPSAEMAPSLLTLDTKVAIFGNNGSSVIKLDDFFRSPGETILKEGDIVTHFLIPITSKRRGSIYYKLSARNAMDLAFVGVAVLLELDEEDKICKARIALGAVAPKPIRAISAENLLEGAPLDPLKARESSELAAQSSNPISDIRATAEYRKEMVKELSYRGIISAYAIAMSQK